MEEVVPEAKKARSATPESASAVEEEIEEEEQDEDDEKPEVAKKAREKVQTTLAGSGKDPYPDWKEGEPVPYAALCTTHTTHKHTTQTQHTQQRHNTQHTQNTTH